MTLSVRRSVAALAVGAALVLAGCGGPAGPDRAAVVDGQVISETSLQTAMAEVNAMEPALLQAAADPDAAPSPRWSRRPWCSTYLDGKGVKVSDSVATREAAAPRHRRPERLHPRDHQARHGHLRGAE